jgi:hypothetical protein
MRINARLDVGNEEKIKVVQQATDLDTTEIIKQALDFL